MAGGSGLYINALIHGIDEFEEVPISIREQLNADYISKGKEYIQQLLLELDPLYYNQVDLNNSQRIIRALELTLHTKQPYSTLLTNQKATRNFIPIILFINTNREILYQRINDRVDQMIQEGLVDEVKSLEKFANFNSLKTVGYSEIFAYLRQELSLAEAIEKIKQHTRNYAKRQITWIKNKFEHEEFEPTEFEKIKGYLELIIQHG